MAGNGVKVSGPGKVFDHDHEYKGTYTVSDTGSVFNYNDAGPNNDDKTFTWVDGYYMQTDPPTDEDVSIWFYCIFSTIDGCVKWEWYELRKSRDDQFWPSIASAYGTIEKY